MGEHHEYGPSNYNAWKHCIHWRGSDKDTAESFAGTHHHEELSKSLKDLNYEPDTYVARWAGEWVRDNVSDSSILYSEIRLVGNTDGLVGVFGTADVLWIDETGYIHIADLKSFSDGSEDYSSQLMGYAALYATPDFRMDTKVYLHVLHGGICKVETIETTMGECVRQTAALVEKVKARAEEYHLCKACQYCSNIKECPMANSAVQVVHGNGEIDFSKMSLPQKLVIVESVEKLCKSLKDEAKKQAIDNGGVLEADGIRYEIKERAGKGKVRDLCEIAESITPLPDDKMVYISREKLLSLCELQKTAFISAMKEVNDGNKNVKKKDIEAWCASFYDKGETQQVLTRIK